MKKIVLSAIVIATFNNIASAGGDIVPTLYASTTDSWNGFYVGIQAGGAWGNADVDYKAGLQNDHYLSETHGLDVNGFTGGVFAGYNWLLNKNWLVGIEGEWNYISADDTDDVVDSITGVSRYPHQTTVEQKWDASLRLRTGYVLGDYLPYITGGIAWGRFNEEFYIPGRPVSKDITLTGWTIGTGLEIRLTDNIHGRIQYRYTDYGNKTKRLIENGGVGDFDAKLNYNSHLLTFGIVYRF